MKDYTIEVLRTETRTLTFDVKAEFLDEALDIAAGRAADSDFACAASGCVEYESREA